MASTGNTALPQLESGTLKAIGTIGAHRNPYLPDLPTLQEQAPEFGEFHKLTAELRPRNFLVGPKGMPPELVAKLNKALQEALADPLVTQALTKAKLGKHYGDPKQLQALFARLPVLTNVLKQAGTRILD